MKQSEFANLHGVSRKTVTSWKARGWLVMEGDEVDVEASNQNIERYRKTVTQPEGNKEGNNKVTGNSKGNKTKETPAQAAERLIAQSGATLSYDEARTLKENYFALLAKLEYEEKSGQLMPFDQMLNEVSNEYSRVRTRLAALAPEHGPRLRQVAITTDDVGFVDALQDVLHEVMNELSIDKQQPGAKDI